MEYAKPTTDYYCGVDLHARTMYITVMDRAGDPLVRRSLRNDFGKESYGGPRPPAGTGVHHYVFTLYPLKAKSLSVRSEASLGEIREVIRKDALDQAALPGTFEKK